MISTVELCSYAYLSCYVFLAKLDCFTVVTVSYFERVLSDV